MQGSADQLYVGVSGFSYTGWKGKFYPEGAKSEEFLSYYSRKLSSVEINSSFYAAPGPAMVKNWVGRTSEGFRFSFKAPRQITHIAKLGKGAAESAETMSKTLGLLGPRRGPVLFQLPPYLKADLRLLEDFMSKTSDVEPKVFEFRHESWLQEPVYRLLERGGAGFCVAETEDLPPVHRATGDIAYFRLRKDSYTGKEIESWAGKIEATSKDSREAYVYLRHDESGENALHAERLSAKLHGEGGPRAR